MAHLLGAEKISHEFPTKRVFDDVTLGINEGDRVGIVGRNGDGKSTLLKILSKRLDPDGGRVTWRRGITVGVLDQGDTLDPSDTVGHAIVGDMPEHVWAGDARVRDVIAGLVKDLAWDAKVRGLSGGQRRRVALAALLVGDWDVLMLDEPTNHLDIEAITWLAAHLRLRWGRAEGGLVMVTHDRWFLDEVATLTWEVHDRVVEPFEGGYAAYILQRVERDRQAAAVEAKRRNLARKELAWLRRGAPARTSKPKFRIDAANELISAEPPVRDSVELSKLATARLGKDVIDLIDVGVTYGEHVVLRDVEWRLAPGERTGILGVNGAGKSTLLGLLTGAVHPTAGRVKRGKTVRVATLRQEYDPDAFGDERVREVVGRKRTEYRVGDRELTPTQMLERLGFTTEQLQAQVRSLSGGQRRRFELMLILLDEPNVLVLDEPTNDLDTDMLAAVEDLLDTWPGTLIVVSHDRYFLERVTDQQFAILPGQDGAGRLRHLPGGVDEYLQLLARQEERGGQDAREQRDPAGRRQTADEAPASELSGAERRAAQKELAALERRMAKLQAEIARSQGELATLDQRDYELLAREAAAVTQLQDELVGLEERWLELSDRLG